MKIEIIKETPASNNFTVNPIPANENDVKLAKIGTIQQIIGIAGILAVPVTIGIMFKILTSDED